MPVIAISRELGSDAQDIAEKVAQRLNYHLVDQAAITRVLNEYGLVDFDQEVDSVPGLWERMSPQHGTRRAILADMLNQVILTFAHHDNVVILGRGGFAVLGGFADVLRVKIQAPLPIRVKRVMQEQAIDGADQAEQVVSHSDRAQAAFLSWFRGVRLDSTRNFDLVVDTGKVSPNLIVNWLVAAAQDLRRKTVADEPFTETIEVERLLDSVVAWELGHRPVQTPADARQIG